MRNPLVWLTALAAALRLPTLTIESLWYDEAFTAWLAVLPVSNLLAATLNDVHPPTWYLIEAGMVRIFGNSELSLRLVSALAGIALVPAVYRLARSFNFPRENQAAAALLAAVAPFAVYYSQEARVYSLIYLLTTIATIALLERRYWLLVLAAASVLWLHNLTIFYVAALIWLAGYRRDWRAVGAIAIAGVLWLPWVWFGLLPQVADVSNGFWVRPPTIGTPVYILTAWVFSTKAVLLVFVTVPLLAVGLLRSKPHPELWGLVLIPLALCTIASVLLAPVLVDRVIGSSAVSLWLLISSQLAIAPANGDGRLSPRLAILPASFALVLVAFYGLYWGTDHVGRYQWDTGLSPLIETIQPDDAIYHANTATYITMVYYLPNDQYIWPQANDLATALTPETKIAMRMNQAGFDDVACNHSRWWIAYYENPMTPIAEKIEMDRLIRRYNGRLVTTALKNDLIDARIYLLEPKCNLTAAQS